MREAINVILLTLLIIGGPVALLWCMYFEDEDELRKKQDINDKAQQKQALIDTMRGDEQIGLYDDNPKNHGYKR